MTVRTPSIPYAERGKGYVAPAGYGVSLDPVAGFYRLRLSSGSVRGGVRIWHGPPFDPETGEEMDRSWRWQAEFDGGPIPFDRAWPQCAGEPITETQYRELVVRREWAKQHAPDSAYATPGKRHDPLSTREALPF